MNLSGFLWWIKKQYYKNNREPLSFLSVKGNKIINASGDKVILRGFEYSCFNIIRKREYDAIKLAGFDPDEANKDLAKYFFSSEDEKIITDMGANVVRINIRLWQMELGLYLYNQIALKQLDETIDRWGKIGVYVILVLGEAGQNDFMHNKTYGNILWNDMDFQDRVIDLWEMLARRYSSNKYIAGYDIINEPAAPSKEILGSFYNRAINRIREDDSKHILFIERNVLPDKFKNVDFGGKYSDNNIVMSVHFYKPHDFTHQGIGDRPTGKEYPSVYDEIYWNAYKIYAYLEAILNSDEVSGKPLYVGEFSSSWYGQQESLEWIRDVEYFLNNRGVHYTFFQYKTLLRRTFGLYFPTQEVELKIEEFQKDYSLLKYNKNKRILLTKNFEITPILKHILKAGFNTKET